MLQVRLVRSATITLSWQDTTLLVDPWLAPRGSGRSYAGSRQSPLVDLPMSIPELLNGVDASRARRTTAHPGRWRGDDLFVMKVPFTGMSSD